MRRLNLTLEDSVIDPGSGDEYIHVRTKSVKRPLYRVFLYLSGTDLPAVESVTYVLHPTFPNRRRTVRRTLENPSCRLELWTWGMFEVRAEVKDISGRIVVLSHKLRYGSQIQNTEAKFLEAAPSFASR